MESVFSRFDSYNFEADERFVDGLKTLNYRDQTELLKLKLFFYNRFVEPIDQQSYRRWISLSCNNQQDQTAQSNPESNETETSADGETKQLSFAEVMQLVQEGKEVPGVTKPDVQPSNQSPTPSQMQRVQKPTRRTHRWVQLPCDLGSLRQLAFPHRMTSKPAQQTVQYDW
ncbi:hypothetical protein CCH79_00006504 [Gambusia affinis]|uniref:Uncharacterized protein n=1 Tax=Gambusia affinis TaxID=33528 RepID=A0A315W6F6_GAMAF|nr:hypothetical protein CCH79_00006504 [Gambusia affinis]